MLMTGYNLVRGRAVEEFRDAFTPRYGRPHPETTSTVALLRCIERKERLPHKVILVIGFPELWRVCDDHEGLARMLFDLFFRRMNWIQNWNPYIYFVLPEKVTFNDAAHLYLRLPSGIYADMTAVFGQMQQISSDHYHHNFTVSQV